MTTRVENSVHGVGLNQWQYVGANWAHETGLPPLYGYSNNDRAYTFTAGNTAVFRYQNAGLVLIGDRKSDRGIAAISVDGGPEEMVDLYANISVDNAQVVWSYPYRSGVHSVTIRCTGTKNAAAGGFFVVIDAMDLTPRGIPRWTFAEVGGSDFYTVPTNPNQGGTPKYEKNISQQHTAAGNTVLLFEGADNVPTMDFSGVSLTQAHLDALMTWWRKRRLVIITDDLSRSYTVYITSVTATRKRAVHHPYKHEYSVTALVVSGLV